jgi:hypothetical protein
MNESERVLVELGLARHERRRRQWGRAVEALLYLLATICWWLYVASVALVLAKW